jgi:mono/diheme cytochrome c family protein
VATDPSEARVPRASPLRRVAALLLVLVVGCQGADAVPDDGDPAAGDAGLVAEGEQLYEMSCAACHGVDLNGTGSGPPFLDPVYAPDHHPDDAFYAAAELGVQQHHWDFGSMPRQHVDDEQMRRIIAYIRSVQREEGIAP